MYRFYRRVSANEEECYYVDTTKTLGRDELAFLEWLFSETFEPRSFGDYSFFGPSEHVIEIGPRLSFATAFSTNVVAICHACGLTSVTRIERSRRFVRPTLETHAFLATHCDRMTQMAYVRPLASFETDARTAPVRTIPLLANGIDALQKFNAERGLGFDDWDLQFYHNLFLSTLRRDPTDVELMQLAQANSEHSRHWTFKGSITIDGVPQPRTLMEIVQAPYRAAPGNSVLAFCDNSSAIRGFDVATLVPVRPNGPSPYGTTHRRSHIVLTAETHNFPTGIAPVPGAETGTGGRRRDVDATGRGALGIAGTAGYCVGSLNLPHHLVPGEDSRLPYPGNLASPRDIFIGASNGASHYGNELGEPVIAGFCRTFDVVMQDGRRYAWMKPVMFTGGIGQIDDRHVVKGEPEQGLRIVMIGGPAYNIGLGGGARSSVVAATGDEELDFTAVQRGDAEMEQKAGRVIAACVALGDKNPIRSIHDQGAGGPANVLTEIVAPLGGRIEIRNIALGDRTLSVLVIWVAEYQERYAFLVHADDLATFHSFCERERVHCEDLGHVTGDGRIVVVDSDDGSTPVDLPLQDILTGIPQRKFAWERLPRARTPFVFSESFPLAELLRRVFLLPSVGSKGWLTRKVDRSVTGLIARQQCCGPLHLPVADAAVVALSRLDEKGGATAIGEQPIKMLVNVEAGARMAVTEALLNLAGVGITRREDIRCSVNWMWAANEPGEGALLYDAAVAMSECMTALGIACDGGKDSLRMASHVGNERVCAPGQMVVSAYAPVPDIRTVITPDLKLAGQSTLVHIDLAPNKRRMGGSALAQTFGQIGDIAPDLADPHMLCRAFDMMQRLVGDNTIAAYHDVSDGGLITTVAEMVMSGNCGCSLELPRGVDPVEFLFAEEAGMVVECEHTKTSVLLGALIEAELPHRILGRTTEEPTLTISKDDAMLMELPTAQLLVWWEATSDALESEQMDPGTAAAQAATHERRQTPVYALSFTPKPPRVRKTLKHHPAVAILREEGSNGDAEMADAFHRAGFEPWDVTMSDLLAGRVTLERFHGAAFVGGFSFADYPSSAKGWAATIVFNPALRKQFDAFRQRDDTFSLGICNGCQLMPFLEWVPWKGLSVERRPRFVRNTSGRFESRWLTVRIHNSPSIMLRGMEDSILGIWSAHGEGRAVFPDTTVLNSVWEEALVPLTYVDDAGTSTERYPHCPNGSTDGIAGLVSRDGRHLALMPHTERSVLMWQWAWVPKYPQDLQSSPWLTMFENAYDWCVRER